MVILENNFSEIYKFADERKQGSFCEGSLNVRCAEKSQVIRRISCV